MKAAFTPSSRRCSGFAPACFIGEVGAGAAAMPAAGGALAGIAANAHRASCPGIAP